jgi:hypothetical protein
MAKRFYKKSNMGALTQLAVGALISIGAVLVFSALFGAVAMMFRDVTGKIPLFAMMTVIFSGAVAGAVVSRFITDGKLGISLLIALLSSLILMLIGIIAGGGTVSASVFLNFLIFIGIFGISAYLFRKREKNFKKFRM